jgi:hypothetical protein
MAVNLIGPRAVLVAGGALLAAASQHGDLGSEFEQGPLPTGSGSSAASSEEAGESAPGAGGPGRTCSTGWTAGAGRPESRSELAG